MAIKLSFKEGFFDREKVIKALGRARAKVLEKWGLKVRARAQKSLSYTDGPSAAGSPPHAHRSRSVVRKSRRTGQVLISKKTGLARKRSLSFLREYLYSKYDFETGSVVIGPERLDTTVDPRALPALERGGPSSIVDHGKRKTITVAARPFMAPAAAAERPGLANLWKDSVR